MFDKYTYKITSLYRDGGRTKLTYASFIVSTHKQGIGFQCKMKVTCSDYILPENFLWNSKSQLRHLRSTCFEILRRCWLILLQPSSQSHPLIHSLSLCSPSIHNQYHHPNLRCLFSPLSITPSDWLSNSALASSTVQFSLTTTIVLAVFSLL